MTEEELTESISEEYSPNPQLDEILQMLDSYIQENESRQLENVQRYEDNLVFEAEVINDEIQFREDLLTQLTDLNSNMLILADYQDVEDLNTSITDLRIQEERTSQVNEYYMNYLLAFIVVGFSIFFLFKILGYFVNQLKNIFNTIL